MHASHPVFKTVRDVSHTTLFGRKSVWVGTHISETVRRDSVRFPISKKRHANTRDPCQIFRCILTEGRHAILCALARQKARQTRVYVRLILCCC